MTTLAVELPDQVMAVLNYTPSEFGRQMRLAYALRLYAKGEVSQDNAALLAGVDNAGFLAVVAKEKEEARQATISKALDRLIASNVASRFGDPMEWQREVRKDRPLPGRD